jgi:hypothetical protein
MATVTEPADVTFVHAVYNTNDNLWRAEKQFSVPHTAIAKFEVLKCIRNTNWTITDRAKRVFKRCFVLAF